MNTTTRFSLSLMMFLQFFVWGAWYVTMGTYLAKSLNADGLQIGKAYSAMAVATIFTPFFAGLVADRFFAAQKLLGILHLAGAVLLYFLSTVKDADQFYWVVLLYSLIYSPTLGLVNNIAFTQMKDPGKEFSSVRIWGTLGWIATGLAIDRIFQIPATALVTTFIIAAVASLCLGLMSFFLPDTPPRARQASSGFAQIVGADAFRLFKSRSFSVFFIASCIICIPLSFYYSQTNLFLTEAGMQNATSNMALGQVSEAFFILLIPFFFRKAGVKMMILIGIAAWVIRFVFFANGNMSDNAWMLYAGIILHGICYDFFFVTGQIYTDSKAGPAFKNAAQGLITMATYGLGMLIGTLLSGYVSQRYTFSDTTRDWYMIWMVPAGIAALVFLLFLALFRDKTEKIPA